MKIKFPEVSNQINLHDTKQFWLAKEKEIKAIHVHEGRRGTNYKKLRRRRKETMCRCKRRIMNFFR